MPVGVVMRIVIQTIFVIAVFGAIYFLVKPGIDDCRNQPYSTGPYCEIVR